LLLLTGIVFVLSSLFTFNQNSTVDIYLQDTYYIIGRTHILWLLTFLVFFVWTLYILTNRFLLSKALTWAHVIITLLTLLLLIGTLFFGYNFSNLTTRRYVDYSNWKSFDAYAKYSKAIAVIVIALFLGQVVYLINFIGGLCKGRT
jgi:cytochrome c oxidase subunit 1